MLATVVRCEPPTSARPGDKAVITVDGRLAGWVGGSCSEPLVRREALRALGDGQPRLVQVVGGAAAVERQERPGEVRTATTCPSGGSIDIFIEPRLPRPLLVVYGGGPAARAAVRMAAITGFRVCAVDPDAGPEGVPEADLVLRDLDLSGAGAGPESAALVMSMGHYDEDAIESALRHGVPDIALVASTRRAAAVREVLRRRGVAEADLDRVRTPAGRVRGANQAEIALFALADLVALRRKRPAAAIAPGPAAIAEAAFATDPVCGMTVELPSRHRTEHAGAVYHFCCEGCRLGFEADPTRYLEASRS